MLAYAKQRIERADSDLISRIQFCCASVEDVPRLFPAERFDLVLCHTLLEYVHAPWDVLEMLARAMRPGGMLSLLCANTHAEPLRWGLAKGDLQRARQALTEPISSADLFGLPRCTFTAQDLRVAAARAGVDTFAEYGIRIFADYVPADKLADPVFYKQLWDLEIAASATQPYRALARYIHILGTKH